MRAFAVDPSPHRTGFYRCLFNGAPQQLLAVLRSTVGAVKVAGIWIVPFDRIGLIVEAATGCGYTVSGKPQRKVGFPNPAIEKMVPASAYPHQKRGTARGIDQRRLLLNYKPGLGKTLTAIATMKAAGVSRALIVCPAIVRDTWAEQFALWWPKVSHEVQIVESEAEAATAKAPFIVTSYELLGAHPARRNRPAFPGVPRQEWDAVILDESHYVKTLDARRSNAVREVLDPKHLDREALRLFLTGTPIANEPIDLHNQVDLLYPNLWGSVHEFKRRYCMRRDNPYAHSGSDWFGINPRFANELEARFGYVSETATEEEVAGLLPPVQFSTIRVRPDRRFNLREYLDNFDRRDLHRSRGTEHAIRACGQVKIEKVLETVRHDLASGSTHVSVMTHFRDTAYEIAAALQGEGVSIACVTGDDDHKRRHSEIKRLAESARAIFVGTMHSVNVGINELRDFSDVIYAELDYRPDEVVQSMKRYQRIGGKSNVRFRVLVLEGTLEERVAKAVGRKLRDQKLVSDVGSMVESLEGALDAKMTDDEFYARMQEAAARMGERDVYA